jgi:hypothetical protein
MMDALIQSMVVPIEPGNTAANTFLSQKGRRFDFEQQGSQQLDEHQSLLLQSSPFSGEKIIQIVLTFKV